MITIDPGFSGGKGSMSAALVCGLVGDDIEILHAEQGQFHYPGLLCWIRTLDKTWKPDAIAIHTIGPGMSLPSALHEYGIDHYVKIDRHAGKSKLARMRMASRHIEEGHVWFPQQAAWLDEFPERVAKFPYGPSDDWLMHCPNSSFTERSCAIGPKSTAREGTHYLGWNLKPRFVMGCIITALIFRLDHAGLRAKRLRHFSQII